MAAMQVIQPADATENGDHSADVMPSSVSVVPEGPRPPRSEDAKRIKKAKHQVRAGQFSKARQSLAVKAKTRRGELKRLRLLAEVYLSENDPVQAVEHLKLAHNLAPDDPELTLSYVDALTNVGESSLSYSLLIGLPEKLRGSRLGLLNLYYICLFNGWTAHADSIQRKHKFSTQTTRERSHALLRLPLAPLLSKIEKKQIDWFVKRTENLVVLQSVIFSRPAERYRALARIQNSLAESVRLNDRARRTSRIFDVGYECLCLLAAVLFLGLFPSQVSLELRLAVGVPIVAAALRLGSAVWDRARTLLRSIISTVFVALAIGALGAYLLSGESIIEELLSRPLVLAAGLLLAGIVAGSIANIVRDLRFRRFERLHASALTIERIADLITSIERSKTNQSAYLPAPSFISDELEEIATAIEDGMLKHVVAGDSATQSWIADRLRGSAEATRYAKRLAISPDGRSMDRLCRHLRHQLASIATNNWMNSPYRRPKPSDGRSRREYALSIARVAIVALLPSALVFGVFKVVDLENPIRNWTIVAAMGWAAITLLWAIDPTVREKIELARNVATSVREFGKKDEGGSIDVAKNS